MDKAERKGGLRLDLRESALKGGDSGVAAIVPGEPDESEIIRRITSDDSTERDAAAEASQTAVRKAGRYTEAVDP